MAPLNRVVVPGASTIGRRALRLASRNALGLGQCQPARLAIRKLNARTSSVLAAAYSNSETSSPHSGSVAPEKAKLGSSLLSEPLSSLDVDNELWELLDLCSDEELETVYRILHSNSPFSPVVKSLVMEKEPPLLELRGRLSVMHKIESRFRFLAADPSSLINGKRPGYRETLLAIKDSIDVQCSSNLGTYDLETEIFLHIWHHAIEYVQVDMGPDPNEAAAVAMQAEEEADGMGSAPQPSRRRNLAERLTAPLRFGIKEILPTIAKFGSVVAVSAAGRNEVRRLGLQLFKSHISHQAALTAAKGVTREAVSGWGKSAMLEAASKGLTTATARYSAVQGALSFLGPVMWGWLAVDLAMKAIGTDYARVIRAVFFLAQVRLVKTKGFSNPAEAANPVKAT